MNCIPHIGPFQKQQLQTGAVKLAYATYEEVQDLLSPFNILPKDKKKYLFIFAEPLINKSAKSKNIPLKAQVKDLDFKVHAKKTLLKPYFPSPPIALNEQKKILKEIQTILNVTQNELAAIIGCSPRKIWDVLNIKQGAFKQKSHINHFNQLITLLNQILSIVKKENFPQWLNNPQKDFKNKTPLELLTSGHINLLFQWAYVQLEGQYK